MKRQSHVILAGKSIGYTSAESLLRANQDLPTTRILHGRTGHRAGKSVQRSQGILYVRYSML